jgi:hypothetical protein
VIAFWSSGGKSSTKPDGSPANITISRGFAFLSITPAPRFVQAMFFYIFYSAVAAASTIAASAEGSFSDLLPGARHIKEP